MSGRDELVELLYRSASGDVRAFENLYQATAAKLFGITLRILNERSEAEDVLQEVYTTVWRKASEYDALRASPITWLAIIARNRSIDRLRARSSRPTSSPLEAAAEVRDERVGADELLDASDEARRLKAALSKLDARHAATIRSTYFEGLSYAELASREGVPIGTLKSWVRRGLIRLKKEFET